MKLDVLTRRGGGGGLFTRRGGYLSEIKPLKETYLGVAQAFFES